jgi:RimJ/RimL family protein N-acetyltransferase
MNGLNLRPETDSDRAFLVSLYVETRAAEMAMVPWNDDLKRVFVESQFDAQRQHYREQFPHATFDVILFNDRPVGRLYVLRNREQIRILDLHILNEHRSQGIGSHFIKQLKTEASSAALPLRIYLEITNPYTPAFERRGFAAIDTFNDFHVLMEWQPS